MYNQGSLLFTLLTEENFLIGSVRLIFRADTRNIPDFAIFGKEKVYSIFQQNFDVSNAGFFLSSSFTRYLVKNEVK